MLWGKGTMLEAPPGTAACSSHPAGVHGGQASPTLANSQKRPPWWSWPLWEALSLA